MTNQRMNDMEYEIKSLKIRVNILLVMGGLSFALTIAKLIFPDFTPHATPTPSNTNSVQIGENAKAQPQREFLNSDEVGEREGVTSRAVISWIEQGRIYPQPTRQGRAWIIAADYRLLPITAELTENK